MDSSQYKISELAQLTGIPVQSLYQLRKDYVDYCPDFLPTLLLCDCLEIPITAVLKPLRDSK
jgi:hypothetical protein